MTVFDRLALLRKERDLALDLLGPRPPWYRVLARRRWKHEAWLIHTAMLERGQAFWKEAYLGAVKYP